MNKKSTKIWIVLLVAPIAVLFFTTFLQIGARALSGGGSNGFTTAINLISLLTGVFAVLMMLATPLWITFLVLAISHNKKIDTLPNPQTQAQQPTIPESPEQSAPANHNQ